MSYGGGVGEEWGDGGEEEEGGCLETCFNRSERVSTGSNGSQQVPTGSDGFQRVPPNMDTRMFLDVSGFFR